VDRSKHQLYTNIVFQLFRLFRLLEKVVVFERVALFKEVVIENWVVFEKVVVFGIGMGEVFVRQSLQTEVSHQVLHTSVKEGFLQRP